MILTCRHGNGTACRFDEAHSLASNAVYDITVVSDDLRTVDGGATLSLVGPGGVAATCRLGRDATGVFRDRLYGTLVTSGDGMPEATDGYEIVGMKFRVVLDDGTALIDMEVPVVLSICPCAI